MKDDKSQPYIPKIPFITEKTRRGLKIKTILYLLSLKEGRRRFVYFMKSPKLFRRLARSLFRKKECCQSEGHLRFFGCSSLDDLVSSMDESSFLVVGVSYCQKPRRCPRGRFNDACSYNEKNEICRACPIPKFQRVCDHVLIIPTFLYIAEYLCQVVRNHPNQKVYFVISACELSLKMFGDYADILDLKGIGVRLIGRICNTFDAFKLAEKGIKPGVAFIEDETERVMLDVVARLNKKKNPLNSVVEPSS